MTFESLFRGLFDSEYSRVIGIGDFLLCLFVALGIGALMGLAYTYRTQYSKSFVITLVLLPAVVCAVILMVNGNIGAGVAVAGAFSLVRFRSVPGSAKEIVSIFLAMASGLIVGMGYLAFAVVFTLVIELAFLLCVRLSLGEKKNAARYRTVKITIPEDLDYTGLFDGVFERYAVSASLVQVKTLNMGSLFRLSYDVYLKKDVSEKEMIDEIRVLNANLEVFVSKKESVAAEL